MVIFLFICLVAFSWARDCSTMQNQGMEPIDVLRTLWLRSKPASFFTRNGLPPLPWDLDKARSAVAPDSHGTCYVDYFQGRMIKTDVCAEALDFRLFDRDMGACAAFKALDSSYDKSP